MIYKYKNLNSRSGFTIAELLIVIVVIGILAVIGAVGYRNAKGKAQAAVTQGVVQQYSTALAAYKAENGDYPDLSLITSETTSPIVCLGTGYAGVSCGSNFGPGEEYLSFNSLMEQYTGKVPNISPHTTPYNFDSINLTITGIALQFINGENNTLNGQPEEFYAITYALDRENAKCNGGQVLAVGGIPGTDYTTTNNPNTITDGKNTGCFVKLID
jgi:prepilin-type N-terminal cleavage/methylation domain-containing protein